MKPLGARFAYRKLANLVCVNLPHQISAWSTSNLTPSCICSLARFLQIFYSFPLTKLDRLSTVDLLTRLYRMSSAPANESSHPKCAKDVAWKQALSRPSSMCYSENFRSLPIFHSNSAHAKFLRKGRNLKGHPTSISCKGSCLKASRYFHL